MKNSISSIKIIQNIDKFSNEIVPMLTASETRITFKA